MIYMKDIYDASSKFRFFIFADDTNLISPLCSSNPSISPKNMHIIAMAKHINADIRRVAEYQ